METEAVLYIVGTPIGNLEDITLRALRVLREADVVMAEDTRRTVKLLNHYEIRTRLRSMPGDAEAKRVGEVLGLLSEGKKVAVVTDAGMPGSSDPGAKLVDAVRDAGYRVSVVPGPTAVGAAMALAGMREGRYVFEGFLPRSGGKRREALEGLRRERRTTVFFESPQRVRETMEDLYGALGDRRVVVARELTKVHEEVRAGGLEKMKSVIYEEKGEYTIIVEGGAGEEEIGGEVEAKRLAEALVEEGVGAGTAARAAAKFFGVGRGKVYRHALRGGKDEDGNT